MNSQLKNYVKTLLETTQEINKIIIKERWSGTFLTGVVLDTLSVLCSEATKADIDAKIVNINPYGVLLNPDGSGGIWSIGRQRFFLLWDSKEKMIDMISAYQDDLLELPGETFAAHIANFDFSKVDDPDGILKD